MPDDLSREFSRYCDALHDRWLASGRNNELFDEVELQTIALYCFNNDYGANGLVDHFAINGNQLIEHTCLGLDAVGARTLGRLVREYYQLLLDYGYEFGDDRDDVYAFIERWSADVQKRFDDLQAEAATLYTDFYVRWEQDFVKRRGHQA